MGNTYPEEIRAQKRIEVSKEQNKNAAIQCDESSSSLLPLLIIL